ncbi:hypothetical protein ATS72_013620 [Pseudoalteromonas sp. 13-15]|uniref:phosphoribosyltransferase family protein n=1 Tax=Pseudoalteromonas TaxID=53246 RepID=UPI00073029F6|nr:MULTISPECIES: phosphoribosyltransferase family protein [Pseudoalteromonas]AUL74560.1 hypothetical protein ATS72_013620 [Pseudoalteromonas sp. 13-15]SIO05483.1 Phosphoribosyl transferase domain-containing protein [Pseudoalteromonas marina]
MKVVNLLGEDFSEACKSLYAKASDNDYDLIVGIATGGLHVLDNMNTFNSIDKLILKRQRRSTKKKNKLNVSRFLRLMPMFILNKLRVLEVYLAERKFHQKGMLRDTADILVLNGDVEILKIKNIKKILIVDDAIDSGSTILDIIDFLKSKGINGEIHTAVLTVTFKKPLITPTFTLYNQVLLRCPWAMDVK